MAITPKISPPLLANTSVANPGNVAMSVVENYLYGECKYYRLNYRYINNGDYLLIEIDVLEST